MPLKDWMAKNDALATTPATNLESTDLRPGQAHPEARVGSKLVNRGELHTRRQPNLGGESAAAIASQHRGTDLVTRKGASHERRDCAKICCMPLGNSAEALTFRFAADRTWPVSPPTRLGHG
jgi:hypothetical protein